MLSKFLSIREDSSFYMKVKRASICLKGGGKFKKEDQVIMRSLIASFGCSSDRIIIVEG